jgi:hypothetical protein
MTLLIGCSLALHADTSFGRPIPPCVEVFGQEDFRQFAGGFAAGDPLFWERNLMTSRFPEGRSAILPRRAAWPNATMVGPHLD